MPRATVSTVPKKFNLVTCPPDGYVSMRRMTYGELMASQDMMYQIQMKADEAGSDNPELGVDISRAAIMEFQLKTCITEHNLQDESGRLLDFRNPADVKILDSNIGQEIADHIEAMHNWKKQFPNSSGPSGNGSSTNGQPKMAKDSAATGTLPASSSE